MPDVIVNTSPLQYLHQTQQLGVLRALYGDLIVPPAVAGELAAGHLLGHDLPDLAATSWISVVSPNTALLLPLAAGLGAGELGVLALGVERQGSLVIIDDKRARRSAAALGLRFTGTLGVLLRAKQQGALPEVRPILDHLDDLGFRLHPATRQSCLALADEDDTSPS